MDVGTVVEAAEGVNIDHDKEHGGAVGVDVTQQPAGIDVPHDVFHRSEGKGLIRNIVHGQEQAGSNLDSEAEESVDAEVPEVGEIGRSRIGDGRPVEGI